MKQHIKTIKTVLFLALATSITSCSIDDIKPFNKLTALWSKDIYTIKAYNKKIGYYELNETNKKYKYNELQPVDTKNLMIYN